MFMVVQAKTVINTLQPSFYAINLVTKSHKIIVKIGHMALQGGHPQPLQALLILDTIYLCANVPQML